MTLFLTPEQQSRLLANGDLAAQGRANDFPPVVKLFLPDSAATWLLTELDPHDQDRAFGLCDLGLGSPELGWVSLRDLGGLRGKLGLAVERDDAFRANKPLSLYAEEARRAGVILT
jgi:hypothetical protein